MAVIIIKKKQGGKFRAFRRTRAETKSRVASRNLEEAKPISPSTATDPDLHPETELMTMSGFEHENGNRQVENQHIFDALKSSSKVGAPTRTLANHASVIFYLSAMTRAYQIVERFVMRCPVSIVGKRSEIGTQKSVGSNEIAAKYNPATSC